MSDIIIHSHKRSDNFTIVPNHIINAEYLTLEEKMLLIWILSKPNSWKLSTQRLATIHGVGKNKITLISKNLQLHNHLLIERLGNGSVKWHIFETPSDCTKIQRTPSEELIKTPHPQNRDKDIVRKPYRLGSNTPDRPIKTPHPQKPDVANGDVLVRTDSLIRTKDKTLCSPDDEPPVIDFEFERLWVSYPKKQNKKDSRKAFKRLLKGKGDNDVSNKVNELIIDIKARLEAKQYGFDRLLLSTYLNNERFNDEVTNENNLSVKGEDAKKIKGDMKSYFGLFGAVKFKSKYGFNYGE